MKILPSKIKDSSLIADSYECVEGNDSYLLLSGGFCGEDEFIQKEGNYKILLVIIYFAFGKSATKEIPFLVWICVVAAVIYRISVGGVVMKPYPSELWFYDDYMV